jgi:4'-phosphopantetheinyl transferase
MDDRTPVDRLGSASTWANALPCPPLSTEDVHVIRVALDELVSEFPLLEILDSDERGRADRFVRPADRRRYVVAHAVLRVALGRILGTSPRQIRIESGGHGKPMLATAPTNLQFNLSHSGEQALIAVALNRTVGVDIEQHHEIEAQTLAARYFSSDEQTALAMLPSDRELDAFYRCWTRKESFVKAIGEGLSHPLDRFSVAIDDSASNLLLACAEAPRRERGWRMVDIPVPAGYAGALTAEGGSWSVRYWAPTPVHHLFG